MIDIKTFFFDVLDTLKFHYHTENDYYVIDIPDKFKNYFNNEDKISFSFTNSEDQTIPLITEKSFLFLKFLELIKFTEPSYTTLLSVQENRSTLYFVFKVKLNGIFIDEEMFIYRYEILNDKILNINLDTFLSEIKSHKPVKEKTPTFNNIDAYKTNVLKIFKEDKDFFIENKKKRMKQMLDIELNRINNYYELAKNEHHNSWSNATYEDFGIIEERKEHLVRQQIEKHTITDDDINASLLAVVYVE